MIEASIIIPTKSRFAEVEALLRSLCGALEAADCTAEIILIDDTPTGEKEKLVALATQFGAHLHCGPRQVGAKRNRGVQLSRGALLLFVDSDCRVAPEWLKLHLEAHRSHPNIAACAGLVKLEGERNVVGAAIEQQGSFTASFSFAAWSPTVEWAPTANLSVKRSAFDAVGGFEEKLPDIVYGEDVDFGLRLGKAGYRITSLPQAVVFHPADTINNLWASTSKAWRCGKAEVVLQQRHPDRVSLSPPEGLFFGVLLVPCLTAIAPVTAIVWVSCYLTIFMVLEVGTRKKWASPKPWFGAVVGTLLRKVYVAGKVVRAVSLGRPAVLFSSFCYHPGQIVAGREREIREMWALVVATFLILSASW